MSDIKHMTFQESLNLDMGEFEQAILVRYFECQPDRKATDQELENVLVWAHSSRTDGAILDGLLRGDLEVRFEDGQLSCRRTAHSVVPNRLGDE
jgi:hypothetical protein